MKFIESLYACQCDFAYYAQPVNGPAHFETSQARFISASLIKVPILLAWITLEQQGAVGRKEICALDDEPPVQGAGFSWLLHARQLPYADVLLLMMTVSDNLCTNLILKRAGMERLNEVFQRDLGLTETRLERKMMDLDARAHGRDNYIGAEDCIRLYTLIEQLPAQERGWVEALLLANQDSSLLMRDLPRDRVDFYHKTGSLPGERAVLNDWGYTRTRRMFLLTNNVRDEAAVTGVFGKLGQPLLE